MPPRPHPALRRLPAAGAVFALLLTSCAAPGTQVRSTPLAVTPPRATSPAATPVSASDRPAITVPPLLPVAALATPVATDDAAPGTTEDAVPEATADSPPPAASEAAPAPPPPAAPESAPAPAPAPATDVALPPLTEPYRHVLGNHGDARTVYLTFDDGPGPQTAAFLDVLAAAGVTATFCQVGNRLEEFRAVEQRVIAEGHTVCNHSWDHQLHLGRADAATVDTEIGRAQEAFAAFGVTPRYFRAPGGDFGTTDTLRQVAQARGVVPLGWAVDSRDWTKPGVDAIVAGVLSAATPGAVVLLHDAGGADRDQTLAALPRIIEGLRAAGYDLQPLPAGGI